MGEGAGVSGYSNGRDEWISHCAESPCIMGVVTVSNAFASQSRAVRSPGFFFHC